ncbi:MAG: hypothetical protein K2G90_09005 [Muribaculaceae bacterium]|nr:hypothetical protein [Muribaculaceae bacterium]
MKDIRKELLHTAHEKGICADGYRQMLESADIDALIEYYTAQPDWCLERNFPDLETLREHFADAGDKGVFVDRTFNGELLNERQVYVFHNCKGKIKVGLNLEKAIIPMIYLANGCRMRIEGVAGLSPNDKPLAGTGRLGNLPPIRAVGKPPSHNLPIRVPIYLFGKNDVTAESDENVEFKVYKHDLV